MSPKTDPNNFLAPETQFSHSPESEFVEVAASASSSSATAAPGGPANGDWSPLRLRPERIRRRPGAPPLHLGNSPSDTAGRNGDPRGNATEVLVHHERSRDANSRFQNNANSRLRHLRNLFNTRESIVNQIEYLRSAGEMLDQQERITANTSRRVLQLLRMDNEPPSSSVTSTRTGVRGGANGPSPGETARRRSPIRRRQESPAAAPGESAASRDHDYGARPIDDWATGRLISLEARDHYRDHLYFGGGGSGLHSSAHGEENAHSSSSGRGSSYTWIAIPPPDRNSSPSARSEYVSGMLSMRRNTRVSKIRIQS